MAKGYPRDHQVSQSLRAFNLVFEERGIRTGYLPITGILNSVLRGGTSRDRALSLPLCYVWLLVEADSPLARERVGLVDILLVFGWWVMFELLDTLGFGFRIGVGGFTGEVLMMIFL